MNKSNLQEGEPMSNATQDPTIPRVSFQWSMGQNIEISASESFFLWLSREVNPERLNRLLQATQEPPARPAYEPPPIVRKIEELRGLERDAACFSEGGALRKDLDGRAAALRAEIEAEMLRCEEEALDSLLYQQTHMAMRDALVQLGVRMAQAEDPSEREALRAEYARSRTALLEYQRQHRPKIPSGFACAPEGAYVLAR